MTLRIFQFRDDERRNRRDAPATRPTAEAPSFADFRPGCPLLPFQTAGLRRFANVSGLVFDMGDVLIDATAWRLWLLQLLGRLGLHAGYRSFFDIWDRDYLDAVHRGERDYGEAFEAFLRDAGLTRGQIDEIVAASSVRKRELESEVRPFPGVRPTLERLRRSGIRLAVLSDSESPAVAIAARLERLGLGGLFGAVVSSADLKLTKPAPAAYAAALRGLDLAAVQTAFVGHDAEELRGARRAGLRCIAFNFDRDASADVFLGRFDELSTLFERPFDVSAGSGRAA